MTAFLKVDTPPLILASTSPTRARLLMRAGLDFTKKAPGLDEAAVRDALGPAHTLDPSDVAEVLARGKAEAVSEFAPEAFVIGADQVLSLDNAILSKPRDMDEARAQLLDLSGRTHRLHTAVALAKDGNTVWAFTDVATLTMRPLTPAFIGRYLAAAGEAVLGSVGGYQVEQLGVQLFEKIEGDFFSILGLPLLPLLGALRREQAIGS